MNQTPPKSNTNGLIFLLLGLLVLLAGYTYKKSNDYSVLKTAFDQEKVDLQKELDEIIGDYKDLSVKKEDVSAQLVNEVSKIVALRDSVKKIEDKNYKLLRFYRRQTSLLQRRNRELFTQVDSLNYLNKALKAEKMKVAEQLKETNELSKELAAKNNDLETTNKKLEEKIEIATALKIEKINALAMKERSSGKLTSTSRSSRTDAFRVNFKLPKSELAASGKKDIHVQIHDMKKNVVEPKGVAKLKNGDTIEFSDKLIADYSNNDVDVLSLVLVDREQIHKGEYKVNIFVDGYFSASTKIELR